MEIMCTRFSSAGIRSQLLLYCLLHWRSHCTPRQVSESLVKDDTMSYV